MELTRLEKTKIRHSLEKTFSSKLSVNILRLFQMTLILHIRTMSWLP